MSCWLIVSDYLKNNGLIFGNIPIFTSGSSARLAYRQNAALIC
jgi:hypothetical protein